MSLPLDSIDGLGKVRRYIGNCEVHGIIGRGGCGIVYLAYNLRSMHTCALKTFRNECCKNANQMELLTEEASALIDLGDYPHVVKTYEVYKDFDDISARNSKLYIEMEFITSEDGLNTLRDHLEWKPPNLSQALKLSIQVCRGMEYAYSKGMRCHRDLKPSNILIDQEKMAKISDFGLAGFLGASEHNSPVEVNVHNGNVGLSSMSSECFGTPSHMPPEQFKNVASCDERSDIYAFGVTLYQIASAGKLPFEAELPRDNSQQEKRRFWKEMRILHNESPVPRLDSLLFPIIEHCLEKEPSDRYQTFERLRADLESLLKRQTGQTVGRRTKAEGNASDTLISDVRRYRSLQGLGRYKEADELYDSIMDRCNDPNSRIRYADVGMVFYNLYGACSTAVEYLMTAIQLDDRNPFTHDLLGRIYVDQGFPKQAIVELRKAICLNPKSANSHASLAAAYCLMGANEEAIAELKLAVKLNPRDPRSRIFLRRLYEERGVHPNNFTDRESDSI